jgi:hypothetical protein
MAAGNYAFMRASTADRERAIKVLQAGFVEGRLSREEFGQRLGQAFLLRTFAELMALTADLPAGPFGEIAGASGHPRAPADEPAGRRDFGLPRCLRGPCALMGSERRRSGPSLV